MPTYTCPVCFYAGLELPPADFTICDCCGTEFGYDDAGLTWDELRERWLAHGAHWFYGNPPQGWSATAQLLLAGYGVKFTAARAETQTGGVLTFTAA